MAGARASRRFATGTSLPTGGSAPSRSPRREIYEEYLLVESGLLRTLLIKRIEDSVSVYGHDGRRGFVVLDGNLESGSEAEAEGYYRAHGEYYLRALPFKWMDPGVRVTKSEPDERYELLRIESEQGVGRAWTDVWVAAIDKKTHLLHEARPPPPHRKLDGSGARRERDHLSL